MATPIWRPVIEIRLIRACLSGQYPFPEGGRFHRGWTVQLEFTTFMQNNEFWGTDNVQGQISEHSLVPSGVYWVYYPSNMFRNMRSFNIWNITRIFPSFSSLLAEADVRWREKRDLCHGSKMAILSMLRGLATEPLCNAGSAWRI